MPSNIFGNVLQLTPVAEVLREAKADSKRPKPFPPLDYFIKQLEENSFAMSISVIPEKYHLVLIETTAVSTWC